MATTASRREGVYKPSVPFCGKGGARERADDFFPKAKKKSEQSGLCSDVEGTVKIDMFVSAKTPVRRVAHQLRAQHSGSQLEARSSKMSAR